MLRWAVASAAALGLLLGWSTLNPSFDLDAWRLDQVAQAQEIVPPTALPEAQPIASATPTPTPVPTAPTPGPDLTPAEPTEGAMVVDCDALTSGVQTSCTFSDGSRFFVQVHVTATPPGGYYGFNVKLRWTDDVLAYLPTDSASEEALWAGCTFPARADSRATLLYGCVLFPLPAEESISTGAILQFEMECQAQGVTALALVSRDSAGQPATYFVDANLEPLVSSTSAAVITCGPTPTATPSVTPGQMATPPPTATSTPGRPATPTVVPPEADLPATPGTIVEKDISLGGGRIDTPDGRVSIEFPERAVTEPLRVKITHKDVRELKHIPGHPFMMAWEFEAFSLDRDLARVDEFPADVRIVINYTPEDLFGRSPDTLQLWTWDEREEKWEALASERLPHSGTLVAEVNHFSVYSGTGDPNLLQAPFLEAFQTDLHTGASQVTVPIEVPPGRGGLTPNLTLAYNSNLVNEMKTSLSQASWVGTGWDLGIGAVRKVFVEGGSPRYFLELNGVSDELIEDGGVWRTKHHQYLRIEQIGICNDPDTVLGDPNPEPPCHWVVTDKQGTKYIFGGTVFGADAGSARYYDFFHGNPNHFHLFYYRWDLKQVSDTHGNVLTYVYDQQILNDCPTEETCTYTGPCDSGIPCQPWVFSAYLEKIAYNVNDDFTANFVEIEFVLGSHYDNGPPPPDDGYPPIPLRWDSPKNLDDGDPVNCSGVFLADVYKSEETRFLDQIVVRADGGSGLLTVRSYDFDYDSTTPTIDNKFERTAFPDCVPTAGIFTLDKLDFKGKLGGVLRTMAFGYFDGQNALHFAFRNDTGIELDQQGNKIEFYRPFLFVATNGYGGYAAYTYDELWNVPVGPPVVMHWSRVVAERRELWQSNQALQGAVDPMITRYEYGFGPAYFVEGDDFENEEYRGFATVDEIHGDVALPADPHTVHIFFTTGIGSDEIRSGREKETQVFDAFGTLWQKIVYTWTADELPGGCSGDCAYFVKLDAVDTYDGPSTPLVRIRTEYEYDAGGNLDVERQHGIYPNTGDERTISRPHHLPPNPDLPSPADVWIFTPKRENIYDGALSRSEIFFGTPVGETAYFYDGSIDVTQAPTKGELSAVHRGPGDYNGAYFDTYYEYSLQGNQTAESVPTTEERIVDQVDTLTIPIGVARTTLAYDTTHFAFVETITHPENIAVPGDRQTLLEWDERMATVTQRTEPNGRVVHFDYDQFGRLEKTWDDNIDTSNYPTTEHIYTWTGTGINSTETLHRTAPGSGNVLTERHCFDGFGREIQSRQSYTSTMESVVETNYNGRGQVAYTSEPFEADPVCTAPGTTVPAPPQTAFEYSPLGEVTQIVNPGLATTQRSILRNGLTTTTIDENSHKVESVMDAFGRLTLVNEYTGNGTTETYGLSATTSYAYDTMGDLTGVTDDIGNQTTMFYNALGRKTQMVDPDMGDWRYLYDDAGNLTQQTDARGCVVSMVYDSLNRVTGKSYDVRYCDAPVEQPVTYIYDQYDSGFCSGGAPVGQLTKMDDRSGTTIWCYDLRGRVTLERRIIDGETYDVTRTYDSADRVDNLIYPDNEPVKHLYDPVSGQPNGLSGDSPYVVGAAYDPAFRSIVVKLGTTPITVFSTYDDRGRLIGNHAVRGINDLQFLSYGHDGVGNVFKIIDWNAVETQVYCYDHLDRLEKAYLYPNIKLFSPCSSPGAQPWAEYTYDKIGNLTKQGEPGVGWYVKYPSSTDLGPHHAPISVHESPNLNDPTAIIRTYQYDANGNLLGWKEGPAGNPVDSDGDFVSDAEELLFGTNPDPDLNPLLDGLDTDNDGCADGRELGSNELWGGRRDPLYFWDFFNPERVFSPQSVSFLDLLAVLRHFNTASVPPPTKAEALAAKALPEPPNVEYWAPADRGGIMPGGDPWDELPPDGAIGFFDQLSMMRQFNHDCTDGPSFPDYFQRYGYDAENRLFYQAQDGLVTTYVYDGQGSLVKKTVEDYDPGMPTERSTTVYVGGIYEKNTIISTGVSVITKYYRFGGRRVAMRQIDGPSDTLSFLLADHLGSTSTVVDAGGNAVGSQKYYPFGRTRSGTVPTDKLFTGHQKEGSLYFMQARFYDPTLGRFLSPDSIVPGYGNPQALNRYSYVLNNPLRYTDRTGRCHSGPFCLHRPELQNPPIPPVVTGSLELYPLATTGIGSALLRNPWVAGAAIAGLACIEFCSAAGEGLYQAASGAVGAIAGGTQSLGCSLPIVSCSSPMHQGDEILGPWGPLVPVQNPRLGNAVDEIYRIENKRPGGTSGELQREREAGGARRHEQKARGWVRGLENILREEPLSDSDRDVAEAMKKELEEALEQ